LSNEKREERFVQDNHLEEEEGLKQWRVELLAIEGLDP